MSSEQESVKDPGFAGFVPCPAPGRTISGDRAEGSITHIDADSMISSRDDMCDVTAPAWATSHRSDSVENMSPLQAGCFGLFTPHGGLNNGVTGYAKETANCPLI